MHIYLKIFFFSLVLLFDSAHAQTVIKVSGDEALISLPDQHEFEPGSRIQLLNSKLEKIGDAKIVKVSGNKRTALCKVTNGRVEVGFGAS